VDLRIRAQKIREVPGIAVLRYNGGTYGKAYLITYKVGPLQTRTLVPSVLPLLEAPAESVFWNLLEFGRRIPFDAPHGCETCPLEAHFLSREQPKVTRSETWRVRWLSEALSHKPEGRRFETRWGEILNLHNPSGRTRPWGLLSL
jgi:hypothetical protein